MRLTLLIPLLLVLSGPAQAQTRPVVVELFTSQGCDSCPPADRILGMLTERADVIALSLHVDYWDYLGWADTFAMPGFTKRQRAFAHALNERTVFTPQMIVQGAASIVGSYERDLEREIRHQASQPQLVNMSADRDPDKVSVSLSPVGEGVPPSVVYCVEYSPLETVSIERGENAGQRIDYANVVKAWTRIGEWDGQSEKTITAPLMGGMPVVVIVQEKGTGPILAAMKVR